MAPRNNVDESEAAATVFGNLGLDEGDFDGGEDTSAPEDDGLDDESDDDSGALADPVGDNEDDDGTDGLDDMRLEDSEDVSHSDPALPSHKIDKKGNIVDKKTGKILARSGAEARLFRNAYKAQRENITLKATAGEYQRRLNKAIDIGKGLYRDLQAAKAAGGGDETGKKLGLSNAEQLEAFQMYALGKSNPEDFLKKILTRAAVRGIDVKKLGLEGGIDVKSLSETLLAAIDQRLAPVKTLTESQRKEQEASERKQQFLDEANEEVTDFFRSNPGAVKYGRVFEKVYSNPANANISLGEVWAKIQLAALKARKPQRNNPDRRSPPNGRRRGGPPAGGGSLNLDRNYADILNEVLDEESVT